LKGGNKESRPRLSPNLHREKEKKKVNTVHQKKKKGIGKAKRKEFFKNNQQLKKKRGTAQRGRGGEIDFEISAYHGGLETKKKAQFSNEGGGQGGRHRKESKGLG